MFWTVKKPPLPFTVFFSKNQKKALLHTGTKKKKLPAGTMSEPAEKKGRSSNRKTAQETL